MDMSYWRSRPQRSWLGGNAVELLENGERYFPAVFKAIAEARHEVLIETFILFEDRVGVELQRVLIDAARRGVRIDLSVDGWGSPSLSPRYIGALADAGVQLRAFDPPPRWSPRRLHMFRRMHRKIVVADGRIAFVAGINFSADHLGDFGPEAKQDYGMRIEGPLAARIRGFAIAQLEEAGRRGRVRLPMPEPAGEAEAMFVTRDNSRHRDAIERQYRAAIRSARHEIIIANAYFFPGYRLLKAMRDAANRGVRVNLILQGQPDMPIAKYAAATLHGYLMRAGVQIYEYCKRPLHGKVALIDDEWATVGSSNLDPLSLALNLEANVIVRDRSFAQELRDALERLMREECRRVQGSEVAARRAGWRALLDVVAYHVTRHFPSWAGWLPAHTPRVQTFAHHPPALQADAPAQAELAPAAPVPPAGEAHTEDTLARVR